MGECEMTPVIPGYLKGAEGNVALSQQEVAAIYGVAPQRFVFLRKQEGFPVPFAVNKRGQSVWYLSAIRKHIRELGSRTPPTP